MRLLAATIFLLFTGSALGQLSAPVPAKLYAVVFQATVNASGKIDTLTKKNKSKRTFLLCGGPRIGCRRGERDARY